MNCDHVTLSRTNVDALSGEQVNQAEISGETYGHASKCFASNLALKRARDNSETEAARCHITTCMQNSRTNRELQLLINGVMRPCTNGIANDPLYLGSIYCSDHADLCAPRRDLGDTGNADAIPELQSATEPMLPCLTDVSQFGIPVIVGNPLVSNVNPRYFAKRLAEEGITTVTIKGAASSPLRTSFACPNSNV